MSLSVGADSLEESSEVYISICAKSLLHSITHDGTLLDYHLPHKTPSTPVLDAFPSSHTVLNSPKNLESPCSRWHKAAAEMISGSQERPARQHPLLALHTCGNKSKHACSKSSFSSIGVSGQLGLRWQWTQRCATHAYTRT